MTMEKAIELRELKPVVPIKRPEFLRYKPVSLKIKSTPFLESTDTHLEWEYWYSFSFIYLHLETEYFSKKHDWYHRQKTIHVPKLFNHALRFLFGKRMYSICKTYDECYTSHSHLMPYKEMKQYIREIKDDGAKDIYISEKNTEYSGWLWITKKEKQAEENMMNFFVKLWS